MAEFVMPVHETPAVPVKGGGLFPVRRIFCVGRNYSDHVKEMGGNPKTSQPTFFTKPADSIHLGGDWPYPSQTENLHYEAELVVALKSGGTNIATTDSGAAIYGYAVGCDMTRRDLQSAAKETKGPWDTAKALDFGAVIGPITPRSDILQDGRISLTVNDVERQLSDLSFMIWSIPEIISTLSQFFELKAGDLIYTGTPEGVGAVVPGDKVKIDIASLESISLSVIG